MDSNYEVHTPPGYVTNTLKTLFMIALMWPVSKQESRQFCIGVRDVEYASIGILNSSDGVVIFVFPFYRIFICIKYTILQNYKIEQLFIPRYRS